MWKAIFGTLLHKTLSEVSVPSVSRGGMGGAGGYSRPPTPPRMTERIETYERVFCKTLAEMDLIGFRTCLQDGQMS